MQKSLLAALLAATLATGTAFAAPATAKAATAAAATVNGEAIPQSLVEAFVQAQLKQGAQDTPELRKMVLEELIRREVVAQAALAKGLDKKPEIKTQLDLSRQTILAGAFMQDYFKGKPTTEAELRAEYERLKAATPPGTEYKSRHILVEKEDEAKDIIARLGKGEKFEALAAKSKDPGSKDNGGDLGWSVANAYVPAFAEALSKLEVGKFTAAPVKTDFGYHVILLEEKRAQQPPAFEQVKGQIAQMINQRRVEELIKDLQSKAKIK